MQKDLLRRAVFYALAVAATLAALGLRYSLNPILGNNAPLLLCVLAVSVVSYVGGMGPGLLATACGAVLGAHLFLRTDGNPPAADAARLGIFLLEGLVISYLSGRFHAAHRQMLHAQASACESRDEAERALREVMFYKRALDEHAIVATTDARGRITYVNDKFCEISRYARAELLGQDHRIINSGHHPKKFFTEMYRTITSGRPWQGNIKNRAKDGSEYWVATTIMPQLAADGKVEGYTSIRADISGLKFAESELRRMHADLERRVARRTADLAAVNAALKAENAERRRAEQALRDSEERLRRAKEAAEAASRAKSAFLANMSHEIRTPLTAIFGYADLLLLPGIMPAERLEHVQTIRRNGKHLLAILNDILDVSKVEAGKMAVENISSSLPQVLGDVISLMRPRAIAKGLSFQVQQRTPLPERIYTDPTRLRQILINLLGNAVKFTERGSVTLSLDLAESLAPSAGAAGENAAAPELIIAVSDTGIGLTAEQQASIFQPFTQGDVSHARQFGGSGLGLTISHRLAQLLGGNISLHSEEGVGSTFTLRVPVGDVTGVPRLAEVTASVIRPGRPDAPEASTAKVTLSGRILLAEDSPDNQRLIAAYLRNAGAAVDLAENGKSAVAAARAALEAGRPYDLILMDCQMPEMDGYAATAALRSGGYANPIVALTANAMDHERERCLEVGCDHFLTKPVQLDTFLRTVRHYLRRGPAAPDGNKPAQTAPIDPPRTVSTLDADPLIGPLIEQFLRELRGKVDAIQAAAVVHDRGEVSRLAHQIKGAAGGYGFPDITVAAAAVESAAASQQTAALVDEPVRRLAALCEVVSGDGR